MLKDVRILLVGDDQVGKSTLVASLIKDAFVPSIQHVVPEVTIPPEVTPEGVTTTIVDSSARPENREQLEYEIKRADAICIVYAVDKPETFERVAAFWLPYIRSLGRNVPVVLVGNRVDLAGEASSQAQLEDAILPIMDEFREVEAGVQCSTKQQLNVSEVFYFAQKAVLHPMAPLYDSRQHVLKPQCEEALRRIVKLCDLNKDGVLDDEELNEFQRRCFHVPLQQQELEGIKEVVRENEPHGLRDNKLTPEGFLYLHYAFLQKGRSETTWAVLRKFGYGDDLHLAEAFLHPPLEVPADTSVELSSEGYDFLTQLFTTFDKDKDGALSAAELAELFSTAPPGNPWTAATPPDGSAVTDEHGALTLQGFLAQWSMTTLLHYRTSLEYMAYLGFNLCAPNRAADGDRAPLVPAPSASSLASFASTAGAAGAGDAAGVPSTAALKVTRPRRFDRLRGKKVPRNTLLCYVLGATGSGKTALLKGLVHKPFSESYAPTSRPYAVVNSVETNGAERYLVMQEFGPKHDHELLANKHRMDAADVLALVYDSSDVNSFSYLVALRQQFDLDRFPCVYIATKSDLDTVHQRAAAQPDQVCRELGIAMPLAVALRAGQTADIYRVLVQTAVSPTAAIPALVRRQRSQAAGRLLPFSSRTLVFAGAVGLVAALTGYLVVRLTRGASAGSAGSLGSSGSAGSVGQS